MRPVTMWRRWTWSAIALGLSTLLTPGCLDCGRRLFFFTTVKDASNAAVAGASVAVECVDTSDGNHLEDVGTTDSSGQTTPTVHALNRECPENAEAHAGYFQSCSITVHAPGFDEWSQVFSGADLDRLPEESAGEAGHGVRVEITLTRPE